MCYVFYAGKIKPKEPGNHAMMVGKFGSLRVKRPDYKVAYVTMVSPTTVLVGCMHVVSNSRLTVPYLLHNDAIMSSNYSVLVCTCGNSTACCLVTKPGSLLPPLLYLASLLPPPPPPPLLGSSPKPLSSPYLT